MGGHNGLTPGAFARHTDRQLYLLLTAEWDRDGRLVREGRRWGPAPTGNPADAARELPPLESLGLTPAQEEEALALRPLAGSYFFAMFAQVWHARGKSPDEILALYRSHVASNN